MVIHSIEKGCLIRIFPNSETIRGQLFGLIVPCGAMSFMEEKWGMEYPLDYS